MTCTDRPNSDGSWDCFLELADGTVVPYKSFRVDGVYPLGVGCDPQTGQFYAFDKTGSPVSLGYKVDLKTGRIGPSELGGPPLAPPTNLEVVEKL